MTTPADPAGLLVESLAEEVAARIAASHPRAAGRFRDPSRSGDREFVRRLVSLYTAQAVGALPPPGELTGADLARCLGLSPQTISHTARIAMERLKARLAHESRVDES